MVYATVSDVQDLFKDVTFEVGKTITEVTINNWIEEEANFINSCLFRYYEVPLTEIDNPMSFSILKSINAKMVASKAYNILKSNDYIADNPNILNMRTEAIQTLEMYVPSFEVNGSNKYKIKNKAILPDAKQKGNRPSKGSLYNIKTRYCNDYI